MAKKLLTVLLFLTSACLSLVVLEFLIRIVNPRHSPARRVAFHYNDEHLTLGRMNTTGRQWRASGDYDVTVTFNTHGFRDTKDLSRSTADDIFVVGDSFSFGWGVEEKERYSNLLQATSGRNVYNISIPTSIQGYKRLMDYARQRGANVGHLIVGVCKENDLKDYSAPRPPPPRSSRWKKAKQYFKSKTALYSAFSTAVHGNARLTGLAANLGLLGSDEKLQRPSAISETVLSSSAEQVAALVADSGAKQAAIVVIPSRTLWLGDDRAAARKVHEDFVTQLRQADLRVVDLVLAFEQGGRPLDYHFRFDGHWNASGHRLVAEVISAQTADWLPIFREETTSRKPASPTDVATPGEFQTGQSE